MATFKKRGTNKPLASIVAPEPKDWKSIMDAVKQDNELFLRDKKWYKGRSKPYSKGYAKRKGVGRNEIDLTLSGRMLDNPRATPLANGHGGQLSWIGTDAAKLQWSADNGRPITTTKKPLIEPVEKRLEKNIDRMYEARVKSTGGTLRIKL